MAKRIVLFIFIIVVVLAGMHTYLKFRKTSLPNNNPAAFVAENMNINRQKVILCLGDSLTQGTLSCNYVDELSRRFKGKGYLLVNAGINGHLAYNALLRVKEAAGCNPDFVTVLIGTNDANAVMSKEKEERYISKMKLPRRPDKAWYRENLRELCRQLKSLTRARIALISIPPMGEDPKDPAYQRSKEYSAVVKEVAREEGVAYLALFEGMEEFLKGRTTPIPYVFEDNGRLMDFTVYRHYLLGTSYDDISKSHGFLLLTDFLHLNCTGAGMVADMIEKFVTD